MRPGYQHDNQDTQVRACRVCGCTDEDCSQCIARAEYDAAVRAEAVAEERQRIASLVHSAILADAQPDRTDFDWPAVNAALESAAEIAYETIWATGSVPVATGPGHPTPSRDGQADGKCWCGRGKGHLPMPIARPGPVATPAEPDDEHDAEHKRYGTWPCAWRNRNQADCPIWSALHAAAEPSVSTGTPAEAPTFDQLLSDPFEQFDRRSELLPAMLRHLGTLDSGDLLRSIEAYRNAPPAAATTAHMFRPTATGTPSEAVLPASVAQDQRGGALTEYVLLTERCTSRDCGGRVVYSQLTDNENTHWHVKPGSALVPAEAVSGGSGHAGQQEDRPVEIASLPIEELPDWTELAEAVGATLHNVEVGCSGEYQTEMRWPDGRVASYRDRLAIISADSELPPVEWQIVFERMHANHAAEVARYRAAIEQVSEAMRQHNVPPEEYVPVEARKRLLNVLAAALGDGE